MTMTQNKMNPDGMIVQDISGKRMNETFKKSSKVYQGLHTYQNNVA